MSNKRVESASRQAVVQRNYRRARDRALVRLAQCYPIHYKVIYEEEKQRDELEGKKWTSIADSPVFGIDYDPPRRGNTSTEGSGDSPGAETDPRDDGAEA